MSISASKARIRIQELIKKINFYNQQYHTHDESVITDSEYDTLYTELKKLEKQYPKLLTDNSPTIRVGSRLLGGFKKTQEWINSAEKNNISWWITSALESNIGLNAIAQFTAQFKNNLPQGLGTGKIYSNNIPSFLNQKGEYLKIDRNLNWNDTMLKFK